jgi:zinc protease
MIAFGIQGLIMKQNCLQKLWILTSAVFLCCTPVLAQKPVPLPEMNSKRLLNDLHVTVATTRNLGENMTLGLVVRYGSTFDPAEKGGLANFVSRMFTRATTDLTSKGIQDELAYLGATLEVKCDWDGFRFVLSGPSSKYERALLLLYQVAAEAQFTEADFKAVRESILQKIQMPPDPRQRIHRQLETALFSGTAYGRSIEGDQRSVSAITLGDVRFFYRKFFTPSQASLLVAGNVSESLVFQRVARIWGLWVKSDDVPFNFLPVRKPAGRQILVEDDPNSPAAQFIVGNLFPRREDPVYPYAQLAAQIFQERLTKLLPTSLLTVGYEGRHMSGPFYVQGQAAAEQAVEQIQKIREAADELKKTPISKEELEAAQQKVIENFYRELGTTEGICSILLDSELYHLGSNFAVLFPEQIRRCDVDALKDTVNSWIFPGGEIILFRGPASTLKPFLEPLGSFRPLLP